MNTIKLANGEVELGFVEQITPWIIFLAVPLAILVCGALLSFVSVSRRRLVGGLLLLFGMAETLFFIWSIESAFSFNQLIPVGLAISTLIAAATAITGAASLYKSKQRL